MARNGILFETGRNGKVMGLYTSPGLRIALSDASFLSMDGDSVGFSLASSCVLHIDSEDIRRPGTRPSFVTFQLSGLVGKVCPFVE